MGVAGLFELYFFVCVLDFGIGLFIVGEVGCSCKMIAEACWNLRWGVWDRFSGYLLWGLIFGVGRWYCWVLLGLCRLVAGYWRGRVDVIGFSGMVWVFGSGCRVKLGGMEVSCGWDWVWSVGRDCWGCCCCCGGCCCCCWIINWGCRCFEDGCGRSWCGWSWV